MKKLLSVMLALMLAIGTMSGFAEGIADDMSGADSDTSRSYQVETRCLIDLHLHLDGSISVESARELAAIEGVELPEDDEQLRSMLTVSPDCQDLNEYLEKFALPCSLIQKPESISAAFYNLCNELRNEGHIYAEIRFAPQKSCDKGLTQEEVVLAAIDGVNRSGFNAQIILCCMRDGADNSAANLETVTLTEKYLGKGVCACDLAGAEALFPNENYAYVFEKARELGVPFTIHSGEALGPESVKLAIEYGAQRIGHGVRSIEDPDTMALLKEKNIALELCPTSNIQTCVFEKYEDEPVDDFLDYGLKLAINTDNRSVSGTDERTEMQRVVDAFGYDRRTVKQLLLNSVDMAFASDAVKDELRAAIETEFAVNDGTPEENAAKKITKEEFESRYSITTTADDTKVILDADMYYLNDDTFTAFGLMQADKLGYIDFLGVTAAGANCLVASSVYDALTQFEAVGRTDIPVYIGTDVPLDGFKNIEEMKELTGKMEWAGAYTYIDKYTTDYTKAVEYGLTNNPLPMPETTPETLSASDFIIEQVNKYPGKVTIVAIAGLTNIATAIQKDPELPGKAAGIIYMGGVFDVPGQDLPQGEINWWYDPVAADICLNAAWPKQTVVPHDAALTNLKGEDVYLRYKEKKITPITELILSQLAPIYENGDREDLVMCWDPMTLVPLLCPELTVRQEARRVYIETTMGAFYGSNIGWPVEKGPENKPICNVVFRVDRDRFWDFLTDLYSIE